MWHGGRSKVCGTRPSPLGLDPPTLTQPSCHRLPPTLFDPLPISTFANTERRISHSTICFTAV